MIKPDRVCWTNFLELWFTHQEASQNRFIHFEHIVIAVNCVVCHSVKGEEMHHLFAHRYFFVIILRNVLAFCQNMIRLILEIRVQQQSRIT